MSKTTPLYRLVLKKSKESNLPTEILNNDTLNWEEIERYVNTIKDAVDELINLTSSSNADIINQILTTVYAQMIKKFTIPVTLLSGGQVQITNPSNSAQPYLLTRTGNSYRINMPNIKIVQVTDATSGEVEYPSVIIKPTYVVVSFDIPISTNKTIVLI